MKRRIPGVAFWVVSLSVMGAAGVAWYLSQHRMPQARQDVAPPKVNGIVQKPEPLDKLAAVEEVVPPLKRQPPPPGAEDFFRTLPPVDLDKFGDITQELYHGQYEAMKRADEAHKAGKSEREISQMLREISRKSSEYDRQGFLEDFRRRPENKGKTDEQLRKEKEYRYGLLSAVMMARPALAVRANFRLGGIVVDEEARLCSDVTVEVSKETAALTPKGWPVSERFSGSVKVAGPFLLKIADAQGVQLSFHKPGYYSVRNIRFTVPKASGVREWEIVLTGKKVSPQLIEKRDLCIVMEKQGKLTLLTSGGGTLEFLHDGTGDVVEMGLNADGHWFMQGTRGKDISIVPPKHLPKKCVYAVPKTDNKGRITLMKLSALQSRRARETKGGSKPEVAALRVPNDESQYVYAPTEVRLVVSDPQGGFVRCEPKPGREIRPDRPWPRDMKEAPQEGYMRELPLDSDAIKKLFSNPDEPQPVYFYIKAFGKYGKGRLDLKIILQEAPRKYVNGQLEPIRYLLDEAHLAAQIQILMQPDGSRNLEGYE